MSRAAIIFIVAFTASFLGEAGRTVSATEQTIAVRGQVGGHLNLEI
jgi:hypothetical protein